MTGDRTYAALSHHKIEDFRNSFFTASKCGSFESRGCKISSLSQRHVVIYRLIVTEALFNSEKRAAGKAYFPYPEPQGKSSLNNSNKTTSDFHLCYTLSFCSEVAVNSYYQPHLKYELPFEGPATKGNAVYLTKPYVCNFHDIKIKFCRKQKLFLKRAVFG